ncbi:MAG: hypothetical protein NVSMB53_05810 [Gemmatimonadaceae bacterium]
MQQARMLGFYQYKLKPRDTAINMKEDWTAEVVYPSGNVVSLGILPSEAAAKARCGKHALHAFGRRAGLLKPLIWNMEEIDNWVSRDGANTYRVSKK